MKQFSSVILMVPIIAGVGLAQHGRAGGGGAHFAAPSAGVHSGASRGSGGAASRPSGGPYFRPVISNPPQNGGRSFSTPPSQGHGGGRSYQGAPPSHRSAPRTFAVPYPVIVGGFFGAPFYGYDSYGTSYAEPPAPPLVNYDQGYSSDPQVRTYDDLPAPGPMYRPDPRPTIYLIALQDGSVLQALGFWLQGDTLCYIARDSNPNQISLDRVDREASARVNLERGLEFKL